MLWLHLLIPDRLDHSTPPRNPLSPIFAAAATPLKTWFPSSSRTSHPAPRTPTARFSGSAAGASPNGHFPSTRAESLGQTRLRVDSRMSCRPPCLVRRWTFRHKNRTLPDLVLKDMSTLRLHLVVCFQRGIMLLVLGSMHKAHRGVSAH